MQGKGGGWFKGRHRAGGGWVKGQVGEWVEWSDRTTSTTRARSSSLMAVPEGRHSPSRKSASAPLPPNPGGNTSLSPKIGGRGGKRQPGHGGRTRRFPVCAALFAPGRATGRGRWRPGHCSGGSFRGEGFLDELLLQAGHVGKGEGDTRQRSEVRLALSPSSNQVL